MEEHIGLRQKAEDVHSLPVLCLNVELHQVIVDCEESILGRLRGQVLFETWLSQIARDLHDIVLLIFHHLVELFSCHRAEESALVIEHTVPVQVQFGHWIDHCGGRLVIQDHSCRAWMQRT